ncbi:glycosyltransferase [Pedobacter sp. SYP-B3415]|uniref:glycosyltransferase n=1 Tax=Pedobacter sp. SYP-B3415 TaxID=2496641 RepID=UPI00101C3710|nr:glycosyltransferase [Pedobacter sp. SYP-B3415]
MKKILFVTQDMARTGSEMVLWHLIRGLDPAQFTSYVLCLRRGELYDLLPIKVEKSIAYKDSGKKSLRIKRKFLQFRGINPLEHQLREIIETFRPDLMYANTIVIPRIGELAARLNIKLVTHVHELSYAFGFISSNAFSSLISNSAVCIGCSPAVVKALGKLNHPNIRLQSSFIDLSVLKPDHEKVWQIRKGMGIDDGDFIWAVAGAATYMKGFDLLPELLEQLKDPQEKILWIGRQPDDGLYHYVKHIAEHHYPGRLLMAGPQGSEYVNYLAAANGFLVLSREESFSLVMVEAAALGLPVAAFPVGIAEHFLTPAFGCVTACSTPEAMINAMGKVRGLTLSARTAGPEAASAYDVSEQLPKFKKLMEEILEDK